MKVSLLFKVYVFQVAIEYDHNLHTILYSTYDYVYIY